MRKKRIKKKQKQKTMGLTEMFFLCRGWTYIMFHGSILAHIHRFYRQSKQLVAPPQGLHEHKQGSQG